jgi:pimeloyl-ACP methyl ester carboxylesterase
MDIDEFNARRETISTAHGEVGYADVGTGPATVFVHGVLVSGFLWHNVIGALAGERRCLAPDLPGHGRTPAGAVHTISEMADWLGGFCDALGLDRIDLVANDTGGAVAQVLAARRPGLLRTLTLTNCDTRDQIPPEAFKDEVEAARAGLLAPLFGAAYANPDLARGAFAKAHEHPERLSDDVIREFGHPFRDLDGGRVAERAVLALDPADLIAVEPALAELDVPTLIAWGTGDVFFDVRWAYWLNDLIKGADGVTEIPGGKLFWVEERAAELVPLLRQHWAAHP